MHDIVLIVPYLQVFNRTGSNLTADGSTDELIKLQGYENFSFDLNDANRDPLTGQIQNLSLAPAEARAEADETAALSDNEEQEELSENEGSDTEGGDTSDEDASEGPPYVAPENLEVVAENFAFETECYIGLIIAHRFEEGWYEGQVKRQVSMSINTANNGKYAVKYSDSRTDILHDLYPEDHGIDKVWVVVKPIIK